MAKRPVVTDVTVGDASVPLNQNFRNIRNQFDNTLSRDGSTPNNMEADLDMDGNDLLNVKTIFTENLVVTGDQSGGGGGGSGPIPLPTEEWEEGTDDIYATPSPRQVRKAFESFYEDAESTPDTDGSWWTDGKAPAVIHRSRPMFLMPEMYMGLETQLIPAPSSSPQDWSGATNFQPAFDAMRDEMRTMVYDTHWPEPQNGPQRRHGFGVALQPGFRYALDGGIDFTGFQTRGLPFFGNGATLVARYSAPYQGPYVHGTAYNSGQLVLDQNRGWIAKRNNQNVRPPTLPATSNDDWELGRISGKNAAVLDFIGSAGWVVKDLRIEADNNNQPNMGIAVGRPDTNTVCELMRFDNVSVDGWFARANVYNHASEHFVWTNGDILSWKNDVPAVWLDSRNAFDFSALTRHENVTHPVGEANASHLQQHFVQCTIRNISSNQNGALRITPAIDGSDNTIRKVRLEKVYMTNNGSDTNDHPAIYIDGPVDDMRLDMHAELHKVDSQIQLSHILYIDTTKVTSTPFKMHNLQMVEHLSDAERGVLGFKSGGLPFVLSDVNINIVRSRGVDDTGAPARLLDARTPSLLAASRISGKLSTSMKTNFLNIGALNAFNGEIGGDVNPANIPQNLLRGRFCVVDTSKYGGSEKLSVKEISSGSEVDFEGADIVRLSGTATNITSVVDSYPGISRHIVFNQTGGAVTINGVNGPTITLPNGRAQAFLKYQSTFIPI